MINHLRKLIYFLLFCCFITEALALDNLSEVIIKKEESNLIFDIKYPQNLGNKNIDKTVVNFIIEQEKYIIKEAQQDKLDPDIPGKNGIYISYKKFVLNPKVMSLVFTVSFSVHGAAHPNTTIQTFNFINGKQVRLFDILKTKDELKSIGKYCFEYFSKLNQADKDWIKEGTDPTVENYAGWYFDPKGLAIMFDPYQVAPYVYGPQKVLLPIEVIKPWIKLELVRIIWGIS